MRDRLVKRRRDQAKDEDTEWQQLAADVLASHPPDYSSDPLPRFEEATA